MDALNLLLGGQNLGFAQAQRLFDTVMKGQLGEIELTAALVALKLKGETPDEIAGAAAAMRANAAPFTTDRSRLFDCCGTGGDGANTINVSTTAALVAAACGLNMVKHGNRSVSSKSGSSDLLQALGINIEMTPQKASETLSETGFTFLYAPLYHQGVRYAMPVRTTLKTRTIFNLLGPLANPARPEFQLLGVYDESLCLPLAETLRTLGTKRAMVVHGSGTDEIALHGPTKVVELNRGEIGEYRLNAADFGLANYSLEQLAGDGPEYNAEATRAILAGKGEEAHNAAVSANVAALLYLSGDVKTVREGAEFARDVLKSGKANDTLAKIVEVSHG